MKKVKVYKFDPRALISPPFTICPNCNQKKFGVLSIRKNSYTRRCKNCLYPVGTNQTAEYYLPNLNKKIIYLDQFAISEMMKILNPNTKAYHKGNVNKIWLNVFEKIHKLCKMQLIICPDSNFHFDESIVSPFFRSLKRIYELFSYGISFYDSLTIHSKQILEHAECWIENKEYIPNFKISEIVIGDVNSWQDRILVSVDFGNTEFLSEEIRKSREQTHEDFVKLFNYWKEEKDKSFQYFFERESKYYGKFLLESYLFYLQKWQNKENLTEQDIKELIFPSNNVIIVQQLLTLFENHGIKKQYLLEKISQYLLTPFFNEIPFIKISSLLLAGLARRAISCQKNPPNKGMANDIFIVATFLPYVDAILIDNRSEEHTSELQSH